jgi:hypothetical protein
MRSTFVWMLATVVAAIVAGSNGAASPPPTVSIDDLQPGQWSEVPGSSLASSGQLPSPLPPGLTGKTAIMSAWSGGAYDSGRDRLLVTGGGHADYAGNEVYAFSIGNLTWQRIWGPTPNDQIPPQPAAAGETYNNGDPRATHTYSGIVYLPDQNKLWRHGGSLWSASGAFGVATWTLSLDTMTWKRQADLAGPYIPLAAYDPQTHHVFLEKYNYLWEYDPVADTFTKRSAQSAGYSPQGGAAIDQKTRQFVFIGDGKVFSYKLDAYPATLVARTTSGATEVLANNNHRPALTWDSAAQTLAAWNGGASVYTLDTSNWVWTRHNPGTTNTVTPDGPSPGGTYGRWQYLSRHDAFALVNSISGSVYLYRLGGDTTTVATAPINTVTPPTSTIPTPTSPQNLRLLDGATVPGSSPPPPSGSDPAPTLPPVVVSTNPGQWTALPLPSSGVAGGLPGSLKHVSPGYNPVDRRMYFTAGDYTGSRATSSYRQETWSLSLADRLADPNNPIAGWRLEYPYCGSGQVQPKWPDYGGFHWDAGRQLFWWVAGVSEVNISAPCTGETPDKIDNPGFSFGHVMTYDPATKVWANAGPQGPSFTKVWDTIYDAAADRLVSVRQGSSGGDVYVDLFDTKMATWSKQHVFAQPAMTQTLYGMKGYGAVDPTTRTLYYIEFPYGHLMALDLASFAFRDLGALPPVVALHAGGQPKVVWDSNHKILYWHNQAQGDFFAYHPDTKQWEKLSTQSTVSGVEACNAMVMAYDPNQDALIAWGDVWSDPGTCNAIARPYLFVYRYHG